ncbi:DUF3566 domain-containing protein [Candidatus Mycolicibacterium alkanivorans]|uniref:DUF3566 domain-containing protein n=1 Tax=Candidatus Mycolicibacterium alkanivorans TaxID=2954114 RepID=A0ABS9YUF6_9MYCO|nr:DUF3566 domain-containing protein [Candidatus Mycolicibacterium alkanivorans]MCI4674004.1 DUF3566 domain-containing protein [Candidatus Mycolicibacterium alkanivorans]
MSAPNEPGQPGPGDGPGNGNGLVDPAAARPAAGANGGDVPPWQRGATRARQGATPPRPGPDAGARPEPRPAAPPASPSIEARVNRFITGTAAPDLSTLGGQPPRPESRQEPEAPTARPGTRPERTEFARPEAYASELPDLSGPPPKPTQPRKAPVERPPNAESSPAKAAGPSSRIQVGANRARGPVRASMQIRHIDPWSALKVSLLLSVALFFVWMIAVAFLYLVLGGMGVWSKLNSNVGDLLTNTSGGGGELVSSGTIFGGAALIGLVNIVLLTAMATVGAFIYNLSTDIVGGIEVTLADRD